MDDRPEVGNNRRPGQPLAVVVGAGGMGMAVARALGREFRLLVADRDPTRLDACVAALFAEGHDATGQLCDVTDAGSVAALAAETAKRGPLRALAHVVGLSPSMGDFRTLMAVNLIGATLVADAMEPLAEAGTAAVFVSSIAAQANPPSDAMLALARAPLTPGFLDVIERDADEPVNSFLGYRLSKAALNAMCARRAARWGRRGARIVSLSPGLIATPMGALEFQRNAAKYDMVNNTPLRREGTMIEISDALVFLVSEKASFISGIDLRVDGGLIGAGQNKEEEIDA